MTAIPILTFIAAVSGTVSFEWLYGFLTKKWILPFGKEVWATGYWITLCIIGGTSGVIPFNGPGFKVWLPFMFIMLMHIFLSTEYGFLRQDDDQSGQGNGQTGNDGGQADSSNK